MTSATVFVLSVAIRLTVYDLETNCGDLSYCRKAEFRPSVVVVTWFFTSTERERPLPLHESVNVKRTFSP